MSAFLQQRRRLLAGAGGVALTGCADLRERLFSPAGSTPEPALREALDAHYAQGARALAGDELEAAIAAWRRFVAAAPAGWPPARRVRGYLTLMEREAARRSARQAGRAEQRLQASPPERLRVALFPFRALGPNAATDPFHRALLAMITVDLSRVPSLAVLERERIEQLLRELQLSASGLVDRGALVAPARLLGAGTVVTGTLLNEPGPAGPGSGRYKINAAALDMGNGRVFATPEADGRQADFFELQKQVVYGLLEALDVRDIPPAVRRVHTRSWEAYRRFAAGLNLLAQDRFDEARAALRSALEADPGFALAEEAFDDVPPRPLTLRQILDEAVR